MDEWMTGPALAYVAALGLWVVVNERGVVFEWMQTRAEVHATARSIERLHQKKRFDKVVSLKARRRVPQIRGTKLNEE